MSSSLLGGTDASGSSSQAANLANNSKYRAYVAAVDKALKAFETTNEWADLISALGKLIRVFQSNARFGDIPKPVTVAKRLSQCLHPALPGGVHLKALETYRQIFDILGQQNLQRLLYLFTVGLYPLVEYCGIKVKNVLLSIFEQYILPMGVNLIPTLPGFITGMLLGFDQSSQYYDRSYNLLHRVQGSVGCDIFYSCLWGAVHGSPAVRLPALIYLSSKYDRRKPIQDQLYIMGTSVDQMVAALCALAEDDGSILIQRYLLDFLSFAFPINSGRLKRQDFVQIMKRCIFVILRRDMGLNRRLYQWLLNRSGDSSVGVLLIPGAEEQLDLTFFRMYALSLIKDAIEEYLMQEVVQVANGLASSHDIEEIEDHFTEVRVLRLLIYFMDRPKLGSPILEAILPALLTRCSELIDLLNSFSESGVVDIKQSKVYDLYSMNSGARQDFVSKQASLLDTVNMTSTSSASKSKLIERFREISNVLNALLNLLDVDFVWIFLSKRLKILMDQNEQAENSLNQASITIESLSTKHAAYWIAFDEIDKFARNILFCINAVKLDSHSDVCRKHLPYFMISMLSTLEEQFQSDIDSSSLQRFITVLRIILYVIKRNILDSEESRLRDRETPEDGEERHGSPRQPPSLSRSDNGSTMIGECVKACQKLLAQICEWYSNVRSITRSNVLLEIIALMMEFIDTPIYFAGTLETGAFALPVIPSHPGWMESLFGVVFNGFCSESKQGNYLVTDFFARAVSLDFFIYLHTRCHLFYEQYDTVSGRQETSAPISAAISEKPVRSCILSKCDMEWMDENGIFQKGAEFAWMFLNDMVNAEIGAKLLLLIHSRQPNQASSEVEDLVITELASLDKSMSCTAAKKFHTLWMFSRSEHDDLPHSASLKPFNRIIMFLLGVLTNDSESYDRPELRNLAANWFNDCAKHNDLPQILQVFAAILLNPGTCRVSIQYLSMNDKLADEQAIPLPQGITLMKLFGESGRVSLYHVCGSIYTQRPRGVIAENALLKRLLHENELPSWFCDLRNRLLQAGYSSQQLDVVHPQFNHGLKSHKRTVSDIPTFDEDNDSLSSISLDFEQDVAEVLQCIVDRVCEGLEKIYEDEMVNVIEPVVLDERISYGHSYSEDRVTDPHIRSSDPNPRIMNSNISKPVFYSIRRIDGGSIPVGNIKRIKSGHRRQDSLQESIFAMSAQELKLFDAGEFPRMSADADNKQILCHELHAHMLLYAESGRVVDLSRIEKLLHMLIALMRIRRGFVASRIIVNCMITSSISSLPKPSSSSFSLIDLLTKHIRAILGQDFWSSNDGSICDGTKNRQYTFLELFITIALYFLRSYYLNSPTAPVFDSDLRIAWKCKMAALDFLSELVRELISMIHDNQSRALVSYVHGILQRSKLQKCLLHLLLTSVHDIRTMSDEIVPLSADILEFNEGSSKAVDQYADLISGYNSSLLDLATLVIQLEYDIKNGFQNYTDQVSNGVYNDRLSINHLIYNTPQHRSTLREPHVDTVELRMFLLTVLNALKHNPSRHEQWQLFTVQILPFLNRSLPTFAIHIIHQLRKNIAASVDAADIGLDKLCRDSSSIHNPPFNDDDFTLFPPNYLVLVLEALTAFVHYCLIGNSSVLTGAPSVSASQSSGSTNLFSSSSSMMSVIPGTKGATELISSLVKVFTFSDSASVTSPAPLNKISGREHEDILKMARNAVLLALSEVLETICDVWNLVKNESTLALGSRASLRRLMLEFVLPIAQHHLQSFLFALATVWSTRTSSITPKQLINRVESDQLTFYYSSYQMNIADILLNLKAVPFENIISTITDAVKEVASKVAKSATSTEKPNVSVSVEALLEILHACIRSVSTSSLHSYWPSLQILFSEISLSQHTPKTLFLLFKILNDFVQPVKNLINEDRQWLRAVHDASQKLIEGVNTVIGWQLEQTTWLKRTLVVKHESTQKSQESSPISEYISPSSSVPPSEACSLKGSLTSLTHSRLSNFDAVYSMTTNQNTAMSSIPDKKSTSNSRSSLKDVFGKRDPAHSTQALFLFSENLADLIDAVGKNDDKERLITSLNTVWANTLPYLKAKNARNARFFLASSQLLASVSSISLTRSVWRKSTLDLLLDPAFFKMDIQSLKQWLIVLDHLMTQDKISFKELLTRISTAPNSAFSSLITGKDAEYDMRAQALKRLAFIVLSSEVDQYHLHMPDIQEKVSENLKLLQIPNVHSQVFLCYRVLLIRLKPEHLVGMWPSMITELIHVLLQIEQQLTGTTNIPDDLKCDRNDQWMQLYLAACKLLETLCTLPSGYLPEFQMCRWSFVSSGLESSPDSFIPFACRIDQLLRVKYGDLTDTERKFMSASLAGVKTLTSFGELRPFFLALANQGLSVSSRSGSDQCIQLRDAGHMSGTLAYRDAVSRLEHSLYIDFAEHWQL